MNWEEAIQDLEQRREKSKLGGGQARIDKQHQDGKKDKVIQFVEILEREQQIVLNNPFTHISSLKKYDGLSVDHALKIALAANEEALNSDGRLNAKYILPQRF